MASGHQRVPHQQAGHMAAPTSSASPSKIPCQQGAVHTWIITTGRAVICRWIRTPPTGGRCRQSTLEMSSPSRRSAACIIVTSGSRPEPVLPVWPTPSLKVRTAHVRPDPAPHPALTRLEAERRGLHGNLNRGVPMLTDLIRRIGEYSTVDRAICDNGEGQVQAVNAGNVVAFPQVGGLHHRYQRIAA